MGELQRVSWTMTNWFRPEIYYQSSPWRATWKGEGGGVLMNQCPHSIDVLQWLVGMPVKVRASCSFGKYHDIEVEDEVSAYFEFANGATGQMAAIRNLEKDFQHWEPIGIPIAPLMHLEERKGRLVLVLEKSIVSVDSNAFRVAEALREKWLAATPGEDNYRRPGPIRFTGKSEESRPMTLVLNAIQPEE